MQRFEDLPRSTKIRRMRRLAQTALTAYGLEQAQITPLQHFLNTTFRIGIPHTKQRYVLRISRARYQDAATIRSELLWLQAIRRETDLVVPEPLANRDGLLLTTVEVPGVLEPRHCVLFRWVYGRFHSARLCPADLERVGEFMAKLHLHVQHFTMPQGFTRKRWDLGGDGEPALIPVTNARKSQSRSGRIPIQRRLVGSRLSALTAVLVVVLLVASALALFSSRHPSSVGSVPGTLYTISYSDGTAYALNTVTGQAEWRTPLHIKPDEGVLISHGMIFITSQDGFLYAARESDGKLLWHRSYKAISSVNGRPVITPSLVSDGTAVYIGAETGLYAWSVSDGHTLWRHAPPAGCDPSGITPTCDRYPITASNGIVYVYFDGLYALRSTDGATLWRDQRFLSGSEDHLVVVKNHLYVVSPQDNAVIVLQADNGHQLDVIPIAHDYTIQLIASGEMVYVESGLHHVYAIRNSDERILWQKSYADGGRLVAADDSNLYYVSTITSAAPIKLTPSTSIISSLDTTSERLTAVSAADGSFRWSWQYPTSAFQGYLATTAPGMLYVVARGIDALQTSDGKMVWHALANTWLASIAVE
jgi:outer membrane protein assembly factor BamB